MAGYGAGATLAVALSGPPAIIGLATPSPADALPPALMPTGQHQVAWRHRTPPVGCAVVHKVTAARSAGRAITVHGRGRRRQRYDGLLLLGTTALAPDSRVISRTSTPPNARVPCMAGTVHVIDVFKIQSRWAGRRA